MLSILLIRRFAVGLAFALASVFIVLAIREFSVPWWGLAALFLPYLIGVSIGATVFAPWIARLNPLPRILVAGIISVVASLLWSFLPVIFLGPFVANMEPLATPLWAGSFTTILATGSMEEHGRLSERGLLKWWGALLLVPVFVGVLSQPVVRLGLGLATGGRHIRFLLVEWDPEGPTRIDDRYSLLEDFDNERLLTLGLQGMLVPVGRAAEGSALPEVTVYAIMRENFETGERKELPIPYVGYIVYVQVDDTWERFPPNLAVMSRSILLEGSGQSSIDVLFPEVGGGHSPSGSFPLP
jgi:hypothetical protein